MRNDRFDRKDRRILDRKGAVLAVLWLLYPTWDPPGTPLGPPWNPSLEPPWDPPPGTPLGPLPGTPLGPLLGPLPLGPPGTPLGPPSWDSPGTLLEPSTPPRAYPGWLILAAWAGLQAGPRPRALGPGLPTRIRSGPIAQTAQPSLVGPFRAVLPQSVKPPAVITHAFRPSHPGLLALGSWGRFSCPPTGLSGDGLVPGPPNRKIRLAGPWPATFPSPPSSALSAAFCAFQTSPHM